MTCIRRSPSSSTVGSSDRSSASGVVSGVASVDPNLRRHVLEPGRIPVHHDRARARRHAGSRQRDRVRWISSETVLAGLEPVETYQRQPAIGAAQPRITLLAPGAHAGGVLLGHHAAGRKSTEGAVGSCASRTHTAGPAVTGFVLTCRPPTLVPSIATANGPSPNGRGSPPRTRRLSAVPARDLHGRGACAGRAAPNRSSSPAGCQSAPMIGSRSCCARSASAVTRKSAPGRIGPVVDLPRKESHPRVVIGRHRPDSPRFAHPPPQQACLRSRLGVQPLREGLGTALAQDAIQRRLLRHDQADVAHLGHVRSVRRGPDRFAPTRAVWSRKTVLQGHDTQADLAAIEIHGASHDSVAPCAVTGRAWTVNEPLGARVMRMPRKKTSPLSVSRTRHWRPTRF